ncbi:hypothetical protein B6S44_09275 [Bosea sp. Tri-44]|uniref:hypothetical protein n=1 Tax=Bosea sp. Tri-44 TaxID=1972137 RepID=UPI00100DB733|nr:hypothetical protein [Bosea sp. Tri-44]RXT55667.1 hypothetical protein B6S44_09275 [Bosea sp. Tri-44]
MRSILLPGGDERDDWSAEAEMRVGLDGKITLVPVREWRGTLELRLDEQDDDGPSEEADRPEDNRHDCAPAG